MSQIGRTIVFIISSCLTLLALDGCKSRPSSSLEGAYAVNSVMKSRIHRVCWRKDDDRSEYAMKTVRDIVTNEYARVGVSFTDWSECPTNASKDDWLIVASEDIQPWGKFGCKDANPWCVRLNLKYKAWPADCDKKDIKDAWSCNCQSAGYFVNCIQMNALHEFGHAIGLAHEAERADSTCAQAAKDGVETKSFGPYDPKSIMNYCYNQTIVEQRLTPQLSDGDIATINKIFEAK